MDSVEVTKPDPPRLTLIDGNQPADVLEGMGLETGREPMYLMLAAFGMAFHHYYTDHKNLTKYNAMADARALIIDRYRSLGGPWPN